MSDHSANPDCKLWDDPIVEEVRRIRGELLAECDNDIHRLLEKLQRRQAEHPDRIVSFPSRPAKEHGEPRRKSA